MTHTYKHRGDKGRFRKGVDDTHTHTHTHTEREKKEERE
jgi:hypothetical protein